MLFFTFMSRPSCRNPLGFLLLPCVPCSSSIPPVSILSVFSSLPILYPTAPSFPCPPAIAPHPSLHFPIPFHISLSSVGPLLAFPSIYPPVPPSVLHPLCISPPITLTYVSVFFFSSSSSSYICLYALHRRQTYGCLDGQTDGRIDEWVGG